MLFLTAYFHIYLTRKHMKKINDCLSSYVLAPSPTMLHIFLQFLGGGMQEFLNAMKNMSNCEKIIIGLIARKPRAQRHSKRAEKHSLFDLVQQI